MVPFTVNWLLLICVTVLGASVYTDHCWMTFTASCSLPVCLPVSLAVGLPVCIASSQSSVPLSVSLRVCLSNIVLKMREET